MLVSSWVSDFITDEAVSQFQRDGFLIAPRCIFADHAAAPTLGQRLEAVLNGQYDTGCPPYKAGKIPAAWKVDGRFSFDYVVAHPLITQGTRATSATVHAINVWQADSLVAALVRDSVLAGAVTRLMGWEPHGCRVAQDQVWIKPPHSGPLTYHRDTPYLDFDPKQVCTVWIPLDAVSTPDVGTLEYCVGSHRWGDERRGSANQFYTSDYRALLRTAAEREERHRSNSRLESGGHDNSSDAASALASAVVTVIGEAGCCSFHDGNTWHGSRANTTGGWRRGIGIHYIRGDAVFAETTGKLWNDIRGSTSSRVLPEAHFPFPDSDSPHLPERRP